jgi:hypothetical protein
MFQFFLKSILFIEEIKRLYEELYTDSQEEKERFWSITLENNSHFFNKRRDKLE